MARVVFANISLLLGDLALHHFYRVVIQDTVVFEHILASQQNGAMVDRTEGNLTYAGTRVKALDICKRKTLLLIPVPNDNLTVRVG